MNGINYLLGIDGGGTKTEFLLTDSAGTEIRRMKLGASNSVNAGIENTIKLLCDGISLICDGTDRKNVSVFAGIAGAKAGQNERVISDFLIKSGFGISACGSDIDLALELTLGGKDGIAVIIGTGIVGVCRKGKMLYRVGGRGYMIDKGGSGYCFGSDALNAAFEAVDGRGGSSLLLKMLEKDLGEKLENTLSRIYSKGPSYVASFAPYAFDAYRLSDHTSVEIADRNAKEIAKIINALMKYGEIKKAHICGGLTAAKDILLPHIIRYTDPDSEIIFNNQPMVNAAVSLAKKKAGELCYAEN